MAATSEQHRPASADTSRAGASAAAPPLQSLEPLKPLPSVDDAHAWLAEGALRPSGIGPVGLELEAHLVQLDHPSTRPGWGQVIEALSDVLSGGPACLPGGSRITFEPGGQLELSGPVAPDVSAAVRRLQSDQAVITRHLAQAAVGMALIGADPARPPQRLNPGARYAAMEHHWAAIGQAVPGTAMMCSTSALQVNVEAGPPEQWAARAELVHLLGPVFVAISASSPWLCGRSTGWVSSRQRVWGDLDVLRCGPLRGGPDPAAEWATYALDAPVMLVGDQAVPVRRRVPLRDWVGGAAIVDDRRPTIADLDRHVTTLFPPARLRGFIEIRYLDAAPAPWWPALAGALSTLLDVPAAAERARQACEPVRREWVRAARDGLADPRIARAAQDCLAAAADHAPAEMRGPVVRLAELVSAGRCPGDDLAEVAARLGPDAALLAATAELDAAHA